VELLSDADDRRARHIVLTDKGRALDQRLTAALAGRG
jgi:DNA-binding MarR family transcriptional regulator